MSYPPIKLTPLHSIAQRLNAEFTEQHGWRLPVVYTTLEAEIITARQSVVLADETPNGKLTIEGRQAETVLNTAFNLPTLAIGAGMLCERPPGPNSRGQEIPLPAIYRLRNDLFFLSTPPAGEEAAQKKITTTTKKSDAFVTVADITHGRAELRVVGPASQALLSKVCGLDFHASAFPNGTAKQSSLAKTTQLIIRRDIGELPAFSIIGVRSLGAYVWETILEAGRDFELSPVGRDAIQVLEVDDKEIEV